MAKIKKSTKVKKSTKSKRPSRKPVVKTAKGA